MAIIFQIDTDGDLLLLLKQPPKLSTSEPAACGSTNAAVKSQACGAMFGSAGSSAGLTSSGTTQPPTGISMFGRASIPSATTNPSPASRPAFGADTASNPFFLNISSHPTTSISGPPTPILYPAPSLFSSPNPSLFGSTVPASHPAPSFSVGNPATTSSKPTRPPLSPVQPDSGPSEMSFGSSSPAPAPVEVKDALSPASTPAEVKEAPPLKDEVHFLVSSKVLMVSSPVFKAMLGNDAFREGKTLHSTGKLSIELPDDDPDAMKVLLDILHHRNRQVPKTVTLSMLTHLTILVDKYQMVEVLDAYKQLWLTGDTPLKKSIPTTFTSPEFAPWLAISSILLLPSEFRSITSLALQESKSNLGNLTFDGHDLPIPHSVIERIEARRQSVISGTINLVEEGIKRFQGPNFHCADSCDALELGSLLRGVSAIGIWPAPSHPYDGLSWNSVSSQLRDIKVNSQCPKASFRAFGLQSGHGVMPEIVQQIKHLQEAMEGLSLSPDEPYRPFFRGLSGLSLAQSTIKRLRIQ